MRLWLSSTTQGGAYDDYALDNGLICIGFAKVPDLSSSGKREAIAAILQAVWEDSKTSRLTNYSAQLHAFVNRMQTGDLVVLPVKSRSKIAIGRIAGPYAFDGNIKAAPHTRKVEWLAVDLPRTQFKQDLLYSFGAFMTVCEIARNNALERVQAILKTGSDPGFHKAAPKGTKRPALENEGASDEIEDTPIDIGELIADQIRNYIAAQLLFLTLHGWNSSGISRCELVLNVGQNVEHLRVRHPGFGHHSWRTNSTERHRGQGGVLSAAQEAP